MPVHTRLLGQTERVMMRKPNKTTLKRKLDRACSGSIKIKDGIHYIRKYGAWRMAKEVICKQCGISFWAIKKRKTFLCSVECVNKYINLETKCVKCGKIVKFKRSQLKFYPNRGRFCSMSCLYKFNKEDRPRSTNIYEHSHGYLLQGKTFIHRRLMMEALKRPLNKGEQVHHIDMDRKNNALENLYLCVNQTQHNKLHWTLNKLVGQFLKDNLIIFKNGEYKLNEETYQKRFDKKVG